MKRLEKFVVYTFRMHKGRAVPGTPRPAATEEAAAALAERLAPGFDGVAAIGMIVDAETGEVDSPREIASYGIAKEVIEDAAIAA